MNLRILALLRSTNFGNLLFIGHKKQIRAIIKVVKKVVERSGT